MTSHYRSPLNYSDESLEQAKSALTRYYTALRDIEAVKDIVWQEDTEFGSRFSEAMDDDFNTALSLSVMADVRQALNKAREQNDNDEKACYLAGLLYSFGDVLGLFQQAAEDFLLGDQNNDESAKVEALIEARNTARAEKDWAKADQVRDELAAMGIVLEDNAGKTTWRKA